MTQQLQLTLNPQRPPCDHRASYISHYYTPPGHVCFQCGLLLCQSIPTQTKTGKPRENPLNTTVNAHRAPDQAPPRATAHIAPTFTLPGQTMEAHVRNQH